MLVPAKLRNDFPENTQISLVLNPENPEMFCRENTLFYIHYYAMHFTMHAEVHIVSDISEVPDQINETRSWGFRIDSRQEFDSLPEDIFDHLYNRLILDGNRNDESPEIINNCQFERYPSISFRMTDTSHRGTVLYRPEDYLERIPETSQCRLKIVKSIFPGFGMNFLSKIAIHLSSNSIGLCDPL
jgi:hypothetical protein